MTEDWTKWEGLIINGEFPLRRYLTVPRMLETLEVGRRSKS